MPIPLIVLCAVLLFIVFLLSIRVRFTVRANEQATLDLRILFIRIRLYPKKKKINPRKYSQKQLERERRKAAKRAEKEARRRQKEAQKAADPDAVKLTLRDKIALVRALCATLIRRTRKHLCLHAARLHVHVATGDAAGTAIAYGAVSQSLAYLLAGLDQITHLTATPPDVNVYADFLGERSRVEADVTLSIRVWGLLLTAIPTLLTFINKKRALRSARRKKQQQKLSSEKGN